MQRTAFLEHKHHLLFATIKRTHCRNFLVPDAYVLELVEDPHLGLVEFIHVTPVNADERNGRVAAAFGGGRKAIHQKFFILL